MNHDAREFVRDYLATIRNLIDAAPIDALAGALGMLEAAWREGRQVFVIGNGGSAATASHWACDLGKNSAAQDGPRLRVISLADNVASLTAIANDRGYEEVFVEQLRGALRAEDLLVGISASGNSPNVVRAFAYARRHGARTLAVVGFDGGQLAGMADCVVHVAAHEYGPVEDMHLIVNHVAADWFRRVLVPAARAAQGAPRA